MKNFCRIFFERFLQVLMFGGKERCLNGGEREDFLANQKRPPQPRPMWGTWATWDQRGPLAVGPTAHTRLGQAWPLGLACSPTHPHILQPYLGHPNSNFESIFGLQTVTPSRTMMTKNLWQKVDKSSWKMMMKSTQRIRTQNSLAKSFGLETLWMSNRNDQN